jgi:hypothetical protein
MINTEVLCAENTVVTSGTSDASSDLSAPASINNIEHTTETADEAVETSPPKQSTDENKD